MQPVDEADLPPGRCSGWWRWVRRRSSGGCFHFSISLVITPSLCTPSCSTFKMCCQGFLGAVWDKWQQKKDTMKVFFLFSVAFEVASLSFHTAKMCLSFFFFFLFSPLCLWRELPPWTEEKRPGFRLLSQLNRWPFDSPPLSSALCFFLVSGPDSRLISCFLLVFTPLLLSLVEDALRWSWATRKLVVSSTPERPISGRPCLLLTRLYFISFFIWLGHCTLINSLHSFMPCPKPGITKIHADNTPQQMDETCRHLTQKISPESHKG